MVRYKDDFIDKLVDFDLETLENDLHSIYAIDSNFKLIYFNKAYLEFSKQNNGEPYVSEKFPLGSFLPDAIFGEIKKMYLVKLSNVLTTGKSENLIYECSSLDVYRLFMQKMYPLRNKSGVIIINALNVENQINIKSETSSTQYLQDTGFINQCSNCRRTQSSKNNGIWDWVPSYITKMPDNISHTICPACFDYYWKNA